MRPASVGADGSWITELPYTVIWTIKIWTVKTGLALVLGLGSGLMLGLGLIYPDYDCPDFDCAACDR